jgi:hypothetical protein
MTGDRFGTDHSWIDVPVFDDEARLRVRPTGARPMSAAPARATLEP